MASPLYLRGTSGVTVSTRLARGTREEANTRFYFSLTMDSSPGRGGKEKREVKISRKSEYGRISILSSL